jgi:hypothetical protein
MKLDHAMRKIDRMIFGIGALLTLASVCLAQGSPATPGTAVPANSEASDQRLGSILVFNFFTSSASTGAIEDTELNLTNTNESQAVSVRLFTINGATGAVTNRALILNGGQTNSLLASQIAPGLRGYVVAVAIDANTGCPVSFNFLRGSAFIRVGTGHSSKLGAEAYAALYSGVLTGCGGSSTTARLNFDGASYNRISRTLSVSYIPSRADGNDTFLVVNRLNGSLVSGMPGIGIINGLLFDDAENVLIYPLLRFSCQMTGSFSNAFPRLTPRIETYIPAGRSGWTSFYATNGTGITGAVINLNVNSMASANAFSGGQNLYKVTLNANGDFLDMPVIRPAALVDEPEGSLVREGDGSAETSFAKTAIRPKSSREPR